jgi:hypothetical protein
MAGISSRTAPDGFRVAGRRVAGVIARAECDTSPAFFFSPFFIRSANVKKHRPVRKQPSSTPPRASVFFVAMEPFCGQCLLMAVRLICVLNQSNESSMKQTTKALLGLLFSLGTLSQSHAQGVLASSAIFGSEIGTSGEYDYTLTLTALPGSEPIESYWFAWVPGHFYLQSNPTDITANDGWKGTADNGSIQFTEGAAITAGNTVTFGFESTITPSQMTADVGSASSVAYPGGINFSGSSPNETIGVTTVPEPSVALLSALGGVAMAFGAWGKRFSRRASWSA